MWFPILRYHKCKNSYYKIKQLRSFPLYSISYDNYFFSKFFKQVKTEILSVDGLKI